MMPERLYAYRYRNKRDGEQEWHPYPTWADGTPVLRLTPPRGPLHCDERYEVEVVEYVLRKRCPGFGEHSEECETLCEARGDCEYLGRARTL